MKGYLQVSDEVVEALTAGVAVVALESTIFSRLGLPAPANRQCFERVTAQVRASGAVPALCAVLDGRVVVGVDDASVQRLLNCSQKITARDLGPALAGRLAAGAVTVSATLRIAAAAGIEVFATGGLGGVHRNSAATGDISHDLVALSRHPVVVVSSGIKAFLDVARTLELLETLGVAVLGWRTDRFAGFYTRDSGHPVSVTVHDGDEVARVFRANEAIGHQGGLLLVNPIPETSALDSRRVETAVETALEEVERDALTGADVTPAILALLADATDGAAVEANIALAVSNAAVACEIAHALTMCA